MEELIESKIKDDDPKEIIYFETDAGHKVVKMSRNKIFECFPGTMGICDRSNNVIIDYGYYIPVLNMIFDEDNFKNWCKRAEFYPEDEFVSDRNLKRLFDTLGYVPELENND